MAYYLHTRKILILKKHRYKKSEQKNGKSGKDTSSYMWITNTYTVHLKTHVLYVSVRVWMDDHSTSVPTFLLCDSLCVKVHTSMHKMSLSTKDRT